MQRMEEGVAQKRIVTSKRVPLRRGEAGERVYDTGLQRQKDGPGWLGIMSRGLSRSGLRRAPRWCSTIPTSIRFDIYLPGGSDYTVRVAREPPGSECEVRR